MNQYYYIGVNNQRFGPLPLEQLINVINLDTMVWAPGMQTWTQARNVPELFNILNVPAPAPQPQQPPYQPQQPPYQQQQYGQQYGGQNQYQYSGQGDNIPPKPDNYLIWSILTIACCCWPLGIVAVIYSSKVNGLWERGQYEEARQASNNAKTWTIVAAALGFVIQVVAFFTGFFEEILNY